MASFPLRNAKTSGVGWVLHLETWVPLLLSLWNILASSNAFVSKVHEQIWNTETINGLLHKTCSKPVFCFGFFSAISSPIWPARHSIIGNVIVQLVCYFSFFLFSLILNANLKHLEMFSTWHFFFQSIAFTVQQFIA